jgi:hypothetical protein
MRQELRPARKASPDQQTIENPAPSIMTIGGMAGMQKMTALPEQHWRNNHD